MAGIADELVERTARFVREQVIQLEQDARWGAHGPSSELVEELRAAARCAGLVAPHLAQEDPPALSMRDMAEVFRAAGYSPLGPVAPNNAPPDEGHMHLLEPAANDEQKAQRIGPPPSGAPPKTAEPRVGQQWG